MPKVLESDQTKAWHTYKETDEVEQTFKNWGSGTIHSFIKAKQMIDKKMYLAFYIFVGEGAQGELYFESSNYFDDRAVIFTDGWKIRPQWNAPPSDYDNSK